MKTQDEQENPLANNFYVDGVCSFGDVLVRGRVGWLVPTSTEIELILLPPLKVT